MNGDELIERTESDTFLKKWVQYERLLCDSLAPRTPTNQTKLMAPTSPSIIICGYLSTIILKLAHHCKFGKVLIVYVGLRSTVSGQRYTPLLV